MSGTRPPGNDAIAFWVALVATAVPFMLTPLIVNSLTPAQEELRELSVGLASAVIIVGLLAVGLTIGLVAVSVSKGRGSRMGAGVLFGVAVGAIAGMLSCFAAMGLANG